MVTVSGHDMASDYKTPVTRHGYTAVYLSSLKGS